MSACAWDQVKEKSFRTVHPFIPSTESSSFFSFLFPPLPCFLTSAMSVVSGFHYPSLIVLFLGYFPFLSFLFFPFPFSFFSFRFVPFHFILFFPLFLDALCYLLFVDLFSSHLSSPSLASFSFVHSLADFSFLFAFLLFLFVFFLF